MNHALTEGGSARRAQSARPAGAVLRLGARAFDMLLALIVVTSCSLIPIAGETSTATTVSFWTVALTISLVEAGLVSGWGRTPGMALSGLEVSTTNGERAAFWRAAVRAAAVWMGIMSGCFVNGAAGPAILAVAFVAMVGPMVVRDDHRGGHDLVAGTVVTRTGTSQARARARSANS